jgi:hypothetical protein
MSSIDIKVIMNRSAAEGDRPNLAEIPNATPTQGGDNPAEATGGLGQVGEITCMRGLGRNYGRAGAGRRTFREFLVSKIMNVAKTSPHVLA